MRKVLRFSLGMGALMFSGAAHAVADYTATSIINEINPREYGMDVTLPQANNPMACRWATRVRIRNDAANYQALVATLLSAAAQGKAVRVYVYQCDWDGVSVGAAVRVNY